MERIKSMLDDLKIPKIDDQFQFNALRSRLLKSFFSSQRQYVLRYRWALSLAALLFVVLATTIIMPNFAKDVNNFVFRSNKNDLPALINDPHNGNTIVMDNSSTSQKNTAGSIIDNDKTYLIKQYNSPRMGKVMVVSEYDRQLQNNKIRKVSTARY
jgi:hypothetical protein